MKSYLKLLLSLVLIFFLVGLVGNWLTSAWLWRYTKKNLAASLETQTNQLIEQFAKIGRGEEDNLLFVARLLPLRQFVAAQSSKRQVAGKKLAPETMAKIDEREDRARTALIEAFRLVVGDHPYYTTLAYLSRDGREQVRLENGQPVKERLANVSPLFDQGWKMPAGRVAGRLAKQEAGNNLWLLATLVEVNRKHFGFLVARIDLARLLAELAREILPDKSLIWLTDRSGSVLSGTAGQKAPEAELGLVASLKPYLPEILLGEKGSVQVVLDRQKYLLSYGPAGQTGWLLLSFVPERAGLEKLGWLHWRIWLLIILALAGAIAAVWLFVRKSYAQPLTGLNKAIKNMAEGQGPLVFPPSGMEGPVAELGRNLSGLVKNYQQGNLDLQIKMSTLQKKIGQAENRGRQLSKLLADLERLESAGGLKKVAEEIIDCLLESGLLTAVCLEVTENKAEQMLLKVVRHLPQMAVPFDKIIWPLVIPITINDSVSGTLALYSEELDLKEEEAERFFANLGDFLNTRLSRVWQRTEPAAVPQIKAIDRDLILPPASLMTGLFQLVGWVPEAGAGHFFNYAYYEKDGYLDVVAGQVPGQQLAASMNLALLKGLLRARAVTSTSPEEILGDINLLICQEQTSLIPTSLLYGVINLAQEELAWAAAGGSTLIHKTAASAKVVFLKPKNLALGSQWETKYASRREKFLPGDILIFISMPLLVEQQAELRRVLVAAELPAAELAVLLAEKFSGAAGLVLKINETGQTAAA